MLISLDQGVVGVDFLVAGLHKSNQRLLVRGWQILHVSMPLTRESSPETRMVVYSSGHHVEEGFDDDDDADIADLLLSARDTRYI